MVVGFGDKDVEGRGGGALLSFPPPLPFPLTLTLLLSLLTQPRPDALDFVDQWAAGQGWADRPHRMGGRRAHRALYHYSY